MSREAKEPKCEGSYLVRLNIIAKEEKTEVKSRRKTNGRDEEKKLDLQNLFLCGNGRKKKLKEQVRRGEKTSRDRNEVEEKRHKEVFARKLNLEIGRWNTLPLTCPSTPVRLAFGLLL
jgi:hypothetical protein